MPGALDVFRLRGRINKPLLLLYAVISGLVILNAFLHDPSAGYDAHDHLNYVESLASHWSLPTKLETGQYYSPPLPYVLPALLTSLNSGLWKALKFAQLFNALIAAVLLFYLLKICDVISPQNIRLKLLSLGLLGLLPVFYRSFALLRGEPYLAFIGVFVTYESLEIFLRRQYSAIHVLSLGIALGLAILARQWGFFLFPPVLLYAAQIGFGRKERRLRPFAIATAGALIGLVTGGWFYILILRQYGTVTAFDRATQELSVANLSALVKLDASTSKLISDPIRPSLTGRLFPILYADTWGDYWGYFLVYARNVNTGQFEDGIVFQKISTPAQIPANLSSDRFTINRYLGALNLLDAIPSALLLSGFIYGCIRLVKFLSGRVRDDIEPRHGAANHGFWRISAWVWLVSPPLSKRHPRCGFGQSHLFTAGLSAAGAANRQLHRPALGSPSKAVESNWRDLMFHLHNRNPSLYYALRPSILIAGLVWTHSIHVVLLGGCIHYLLDPHPLPSGPRRRSSATSCRWPSDFGLCTGPQ